MSLEARKEKEEKPKNELQSLIDRSINLFEKAVSTAEAPYFSATASDDAVEEAFVTGIDKFMLALQILEQSRLTPGNSYAFQTAKSYPTLDSFLHAFISDLVHRKVLEVRPEFIEEDNIRHDLWDPPHTPQGF